MKKEATKATDASLKEDAEPITVKEETKTSDESSLTEEVVDFNEPCILGIDEAGRGPVLGPMVYAAAVVPISRKKELVALGADDSKALKANQRDILREKLIRAPFVRSYEEVISAEQLSNQMLQKRKYNLNLIAHDAALSLVEAAIAAGCNITEVYADTVGPPSSYADKFRQAFPALKKVDVRKKADSVFKIVGAASIIAKTTRDDILKRWETKEAPELSTVRGSGYPGDEVTKKWLRQSIDPVFGFPNLVRFSWGTAKTILEKHAVAVEWESDNEDEDGMSVAEVKENAAKKNTQDITAFFGKKNGAVDGKSNKKKKTVQSVKVPKYVSSLGLKRATKLI